MNKTRIKCGEKGDRNLHKAIDMFDISELKKEDKELVALRFLFTLFWFDSNYCFSTISSLPSKTIHR